MEGLLEGLSAPVEAWDAIICTSRAVQGVVAAELDEAERYLAQRFQARRVGDTLVLRLQHGDRLILRASAAQRGAMLG